MTKELIPILLKLQKELPIVLRNTKAFKYKYAPIEHVWQETQKVIQDNGFTIINELTDLGVRTTASHTLGELTSFIPWSGTGLSSQQRGSETTYARRYNLTAIFNIIIAGEDDDANNDLPVIQQDTEDFLEPTTTINTPIDTKQQIANILITRGITKEKQKEHLSFTFPLEFKAKDWDTILKKLSE